MIQNKDLIYNWLEEHKDDFLRDLSSLIEIPSVNGRAVDGNPYGEDCAKVLDTMLDICEKHGLKTKNFDYHAGTAIFEGRCGEIKLDILSHLDVVAPGTGWNTDPFKLIEKDGFIYGRGVTDDKGPALASLYACLALKDLGLLPENSVKLIFGCAEETGSSDLRHYFKTQKSAPNTFTPDADFPVYNGEKGRYVPNFSMTTEYESGARVSSFECGNAPNIVPERARCTILGVDRSILNEKAQALEAELGVRYEFVGDEVICHGKSAHASTPDKGTNALTALIRLIVNLPLSDCKSTRAFHSLDNILPHGDTNGSSAGIYMKEEVSGEITAAFSMLHFDGRHLLGVCDMRLPFCATVENTKDVFEKALSNEGFTLSGDMTKPHYTPNDSFFVKTLLACYENVTNKKGKTYVMGGGTYVHDIEGGVAFGPVFEDIDYNVNLHGANECIKLSDLLLAATIYAVSILEITKQS